MRYCAFQVWSESWGMMEIIYANTSYLTVNMNERLHEIYMAFPLFSLHWLVCKLALLFPPQRSLSVPAVVSTSWTSSFWRCWTDTGTPSASSAPTVRLRWRTNASPGQEASTARRTSSSEWAFYVSLSLQISHSCLGFRKKTPSWAMLVSSP